MIQKASKGPFLFLQKRVVYHIVYPLAFGMIHMTLQASPTYLFMNPFATGLSLILRTWFEVAFEGAFAFPYVQSKADTIINFIKTLFLIYL